MMGPIPLTLDSLNQFPLTLPATESDKNGRGTVLALAGSYRVPGAAVLAGTGAMRAGAGKVQLAVPRSISLGVGSKFLECGILPLEENVTGDALALLSPELKKSVNAADAVLIGPGLMDAEAASGFVKLLLNEIEGKSFIIDGLALCDLNHDLNLLRKGANRAVLTPHHGEMASLLGIQKNEVDQNPLKYGLKIASEAGVVVVLKASTTYVVAPDGRAWIHKDGLPGLATAGSGDVLAGILAGLIARGTDLLRASLWAVILHAEAGRRLTKSVGVLGFMARELPEQVPHLLSSLPTR